MIKMMETITITLEDFNKFTVNPRQRDTMRHATKASKGHLKEYAESHKNVAIGELNGHTYIIDGHTRRYLWSRNMLEIPKVLLATVYKCDSLDEIREAYEWYDSTNAVQTGPDKVQGAYRDLMISPVTPWIQRGNLSTAFRIADGMNTRGRSFVYLGPGNIKIHEIIGRWRPEILFMDSLEIKNRSFFPSGVIAAVFLTYRRYGSFYSNRIYDFWAAYRDDKGTKTEDLTDGIEMLRKITGRKKNYNQISGYSNSAEICCKAIACCKGYMDGKLFRSEPQMANPYLFLHGVRNPPDEEDPKKVKGLSGVSPARNLKA